MAKKTGFNMAAELRGLLKSNKKMTGNEAYNALKKKFPGQKINKSSCLVAFTNARGKLGVSKNSQGSGKRIYRKVAKPSADTVSLSAFRSARELLSNTNGDVTVAVAVLKEVKALQS